MSTIKKLLLALSPLFLINVSYGQQTTLNPISCWVFTPYTYNPAIIGSKDYLAIDFNAAFQGKAGTQILSGNSRFSKTSSGYFASPEIVEFENFGLGASVFTNVESQFRNFGISAGSSYQIPLNTRRLSFFSIGASVKGIYQILDTTSLESDNPSKKTFNPNLDLGIYYYGTRFFTGLSITNVFGQHEKNDSLGISVNPVPMQYFFTTGYKFLLSRSMNIVLEPSILISSKGLVLNKVSYKFNPILKLYVENFCIGTYFLSDGKTSFFTQFRYPRFYVGAFFELPKKTAYFRGSPMIAFTVGLNIQNDKSRVSEQNHW
jgi:type IX secretion system PorP/SprF family membrane protein